MSYPQITLKYCDYAQITKNKTGDLAMVYKPLQNLVKDTILGDFTTEKLNFDRYKSEDMLIVDEFDGTTNIIINDDVNNPKLVNSGFSVQENNTFLIPEHYTSAVNNIYQNDTIDQDTQLFKLYTKIPQLTFKGLGNGSFKCGSYIFYFRLSDSYGNMSNVIQHSSLVQIFIGENNSYKVRMGMQDEDAGKSVSFELSGIDSGFDYIRVFYERTSTSNDQASSTQFFMVDQNYPIVDGVCNITIIGEESTLSIPLADLKNEYADIAACKTHAVVDNTLFMANTEGFVHKYHELQKMAWCIYPTQDDYSKIDFPDINVDHQKGNTVRGFYDPSKVYYQVGYWPDEYYRFGVVFIYNNNQLSPVFNIQGYDLSKASSSVQHDLWNYNPITKKYELWDYESDNYIFNQKILSNSKGVTKLKRSINLINKEAQSEFSSYQTSVVFNVYEGIAAWIQYTQDLTADEKAYYTTNGKPDVAKFLEEYHGIKGLFFVRQKRIPTSLAQGVVIGLTKKDFGCIPILKDGAWKTKSFLAESRMVLPYGSTIEADNENVVHQALLVPDAELQEATFNQIFTSQEYALYKDGNIEFETESSNSDWWVPYYYTPQTIGKSQLVKLTAVPRDTKVVTNGTDFFSTIAGAAEEAYKTEDVQFQWNKTKPQDLTTSTSLIRGKWGYYVGMSQNTFEFGDLVTIKKSGFHKDPSTQNLLEFQQRFSDFSLFSPISSRINAQEISDGFSLQCFSGDCFPSLFTHRMMSNFIDPELPTNTKIVDPGCWAKNYAVRCTAELLTDTHSNLTGDSAGFYVPSPVNKTSNIVSLIFGILTGNLGIVIQSAKKLAEPETERPVQTDFANEIVQAFEVYTGSIPPTADNYDPKTSDDWEKNGKYTETYGNNSDYSSALVQAMAESKVKKVNPKEQEQNASGLNLKALFKSDDKWELHGLAQINRADVNAVSFGQWITLPIRSSLNLALRDVDFNNTTEEAKFNRKRSFYPLSAMDPTDKLHESNVINGATKKTIHAYKYPVYKTVPFIKQEYFNRIYWSKPNVSDSFLNSFRLVYKDQYKEYNKELGTITKITKLPNQLLVTFTHGIGTLPIDRTAKTEAETSPYLASRNVLPPQVQTLSSDFGSMWSNSIIQTPRGTIYGVDTVAKKIWRTDGRTVEMISDHKVTKFLNDWIKLSEFDQTAYQGHIDVKTHYNNFKNDVIFTFVKDLPDSYSLPEEHKLKLKQYMQTMWGSGAQDDVYIGKITWDSLGNGELPIAFGLHNSEADPDLTGFVSSKGNTFYFEDGTSVDTEQILTIKTAEVQQGKIYINDLYSGVNFKIDSWKPGIVWSLCYNEKLNRFITFYDWYPIESCNVDNIFFSFDQEAMDLVYKNDPDPTVCPFKLAWPTMRWSKYLIDKTFTNTVEIFGFPTDLWDSTTILTILPDDNSSLQLSDAEFLSFYCTDGALPTTVYDPYSKPLIHQELVVAKETIDNITWYFYVYRKDPGVVFTTTMLSDCLKQFIGTGDSRQFIEFKCFNLPSKSDGTQYGTFAEYEAVELGQAEHLQFYEIREYNSNRMYLWKHGQAGIYDNHGEIRPTHWYGKQHEFNFEFVVNDTPMRQKIFNNLKIISNKAQPNKFEYEIVGEGYEWWQYKPVVHWANQKVKDGIFPTLYSAYAYILRNNTSVIRSTYSDFPVTDLEYRDQLNNNPYVYRKLPYLKIELTDRQGRADRSYHLTDAWSPVKPVRDILPRVHDYTFNTNETSIKYDKQLNEYRLHDEQLGNNMWKYGRVRGNMQYLEDMWNIEIRPINFMWIYRRVSEDDLLKINKASSFILDDFHKSACEFQMSVSEDSEVLITEELEGQEPIQVMYPIESNKTVSIRYDRTHQDSKITVTFIPQTEAEFEIPDNTADNIYLYHLLQSRTETRHRDKYIKVKVRYSGEDLAVIQQIYTIFDESYA